MCAVLIVDTIAHIYIPAVVDVVQGGVPVL